jgi:tetratricopeptide (TPR) repeat protein
MKKTRTSAKKRPKKEVNVNQIILRGDTAMEALDLDRAYSQYTAASKILWEQIGVPQKILLSRVLGKLGEVKVSLGDHDGAHDDFSAAISLLENEDNNMAIHESRANLNLYLGQVSSEQEALVALRKGVEELDSCIRLREKSCEQNDSMEEGSSEPDALHETR